jgi:hypothetical protein
MISVLQPSSRVRAAIPSRRPKSSKIDPKAESSTMKITALRLPAGHHELADPVVDCEATFSNLHLETVVLTASVGGPSNPIIGGQSHGQTATTLAIRMDELAAIQLFRRLTVLGHSMGWLPFPATERQA